MKTDELQAIYENEVLKEAKPKIKWYIFYRTDDNGRPGYIPIEAYQGTTEQEARDAFLAANSSYKNEMGWVHAEEYKKSEFNRKASEAKIAYLAFQKISKKIK